MTGGLALLVAIVQTSSIITLARKVNDRDCEHGRKGNNLFALEQGAKFKDHVRPTDSVCEFLGEQLDFETHFIRQILEIPTD